MALDDVATSCNHPLGPVRQATTLGHCLWTPANQVCTCLSNSRPSEPRILSCSERRETGRRGWKEQAKPTKKRVLGGSLIPHADAGIVNDKDICQPIGPHQPVDFTRT